MAQFFLWISITKKITMKRLMLFFVSATLALTVSAQTTTPTKKAAEKDMRKDVVELKQERKERNKKIAKVQLRRAHNDQKEINKDRKHLHANKKHLKNKGVKNPVEKAKEEVKQ